MRKNVFKIIFVIVLTLLIKDLVTDVLITYENKKEVESYYNNDTSFNYKSNLVLNIPSINLDLVVKKANGDFSNLYKNLVYYKRNDFHDKIIIFGHSGLGYGAFFNRLDELNRKDNVYLYKDKNKALYEVADTYYVSYKDVYILNNDEEGTLLLVTCKKNDKFSRLVVKLSLKSIKTLKK